MYPKRTGSLIEESVVAGQQQAPTKTQENIPLKEYCRSQDNLRKIQAQSSAETSGLGDSLQRIHTLSSTETSGYGDAGMQSPGTGASPSPESGRGRMLGTAGRLPGAGPSAWSPASRRNPHPVSLQYKQRSLDANDPPARRDGRDEHGFPVRRTPSFEQAMLTSEADQGYVGANSRRQSPTKRLPIGIPGPFSMRADEDETDTFYIPPRRTSARRSGHYIAAEQGASMSHSAMIHQNGDNAYNENHRGSFTQLSPADAEVVSYTSRPRGSSIPQTSSRSASRQIRRTPSDLSLHSGLFLGTSSKSQWLEWSHERRASFKKRLDSIEQRQKEMERTRVSTPIRKARKESIMFVSPELEGSHLHDSMDMEHIYLGASIPQGSKARRREEELRAAMDGKLSVAQWNLLLAFWEHDLFVIVRYLGIILSVVAFILGVVAATSSKWMSVMDWQNAVIGLLIFSVAFGFLASVLSICGVCTGALPKKIYYYHSAGEIFLICALSCTAALVVYPVAIEVGRDLGKHSLGFGYGLGWGASFFYLASALCMCLDDIVRTCSKGCCACCPRDRANSSL